MLAENNPKESRPLKNKTVVNVLAILSLTSGFSWSSNGSDIDDVQLSVEEKRITKAIDEFSATANRFDSLINAFAEDVNQSSADLGNIIDSTGGQLWQQARDYIQNHNDGDDRALYWARLKLAKSLKQQPSFQQLAKDEQKQLLWQLELASRGANDIQFSSNVDIKVLLTGFDPFFLDRHIDQSNPSGVTALMLDELTLKQNGKTIAIQTLMIPVRFADFDQGMIETLLTPYIKKGNIDAVFTVSMGRKGFDLERFPGLRRSAKAPGNLNVYTGANRAIPLTPFLNGKALNGPEFVEFSLPVKKMQQANTHFIIIDNNKVTTLTGDMEPESLSELANKVSVNGSGGGYLSNEISYRSILIRNRYNPTLPVGHIHTPRIKAFEPETSKKIVADIKAMISAAFN